jgi:enamine deaminase RidA (YjgF/YER057c/UK114 family)
MTVREEAGVAWYAVGALVRLRSSRASTRRHQRLGPAQSRRRRQPRRGPVDEAGRINDSANMEMQIRTTYANAAKLLAKFGASLDDVVQETVYVTDMDAAFAVAGRVRKAAYGTDQPACASTIAGITRLAFPQQLVEISFTAVVNR